MSEPRGWYSRGYLPHIDGGTAYQFITWRLDDAVPACVLRDWKVEMVNELEEEKKRKLWRLIEDYCDAGHGDCILANPIAAKLVQDALLFHHGHQYRLLEWTVMPNHVHVLLTPLAGFSLEKIVHSQKSYTSTQINKALGREGRLWQAEAFDRLMRDEAHRDRTAGYIRHNPVKAKLVADSKHWPYCSANPVARERLQVRR